MNVATYRSRSPEPEELLLEHSPSMDQPDWRGFRTPHTATTLQLVPLLSNLVLRVCSRIREGKRPREEIGQ